MGFTVNNDTNPTNPLWHLQAELREDVVVGGVHSGHLFLGDFCRLLEAFSCYMQAVYRVLLSGTGLALTPKTPSNLNPHSQVTLAPISPSFYPKRAPKCSLSLETAPGHSSYCHCNYEYYNYSSSSSSCCCYYYYYYYYYYNDDDYDDQPAFRVLRFPKASATSSRTWVSALTTLDRPGKP